MKLNKRNNKTGETKMSQEKQLLIFLKYSLCSVPFKEEKYKYLPVYIYIDKHSYKNTYSIYLYPDIANMNKIELIYTISDETTSFNVTFKS